MTADDRCPRCDRPPTTWEPVHSGFDICGACGHTMLDYGATIWIHSNFQTSLVHQQCAKDLAAATPSVCWGGEECEAHEVKWRSRALEAEFRCDRLERELCEARADLAGVRETLRVDRATTPDYWKRAYIAANGLACDFRKKLEKIDAAVQELLAATKEHPPQTLFEALKWACAVMPEDEAIVTADEQREAVKRRIVAALDGLRKVVES